MDNVQELNARVCEVLGLDATKIASLKIALNPNEFPIITIEMVPSDSQLLAIGQLVEVHYSLDEKKPANCRNRLRDEGKAYPKSGCAHCKNGGLMGCPFEPETMLRNKNHGNSILSGSRDEVAE